MTNTDFIKAHQAGYWLDKNGIRTFVMDLEDRYLLNIIQFITQMKEESVVTHTAFGMLRDALTLRKHLRTPLTDWLNNQVWRDERTSKFRLARLWFAFFDNDAEIDDIIAFYIPTCAEPPSWRAHVLHDELVLTEEFFFDGELPDDWEEQDFDVHTTTTRRSDSNFLEDVEKHDPTINTTTPTSLEDLVGRFQIRDDSGDS